MVCLEGITLDRIENSLSDAELNKFPLWSWLSHLLTNYIYSLEHKDNPPKIPTSNDQTLYALWFKVMLKEFLKEFDDATPERVYRSLLNPPTADIAFMVYTATSLELQKGFLDSIHVYNPYPRWKSNSPQSKKKMLNPAEENAVDKESNSDYDSDDDSMPDLEPPGPPDPPDPHDLHDAISLPNLEDIKKIPDDLPDLISTQSITKFNIKFSTNWEDFLTNGPTFKAPIPPTQTPTIGKIITI